MKFLVKTNIDCKACMNCALQDADSLLGVFDVYYFTQGNTLLPDILLETIDSMNLDENKILEHLKKEAAASFKYEIIALSEDEFEKLKAKASPYKGDWI